MPPLQEEPGGQFFAAATASSISATEVTLAASPGAKTFCSMVCRTCSPLFMARCGANSGSTQMAKTWALRPPLPIFCRSSWAGLAAERPGLVDQVAGRVAMGVENEQVSRGAASLFFFMPRFYTKSPPA